MKIFTFWEPRGNVTPYLQLCRETWDEKLAGHEIIVLDYSNVEEFLGAGTLDLDALKRVPLAMQKDAVMVAVLYRHGGLFMDMDTIIVDDISPILRVMNRSEVAMFGQHLAFVIAKPGAALMRPWFEGVRRNLDRISNGQVDPAKAPWDFLGNAPLTAVYFALLDRSLVLRALRRSSVGKRFWPSATKPVDAPPPAGPRLIGRRVPIWIKAARAVIRRSVEDRLMMMSPEADGFIQEARSYDGPPVPAKERYQRFWFGADMDIDVVFQPGTRVIGLHHSWTPESYAGLSRDEVLAHDCLLSRTLVRLLGR